MKERIQQLLTEKQLSSAKFAEILEVQPSSISHLLSGRNKPNFDFIAKMLERFPDVNPRWFVLGEGPMLLPPKINASFSEKELSLPLFQAENNAPLHRAETLPLAPEARRKREIERIIICYTDKTFSVYTEND